jgi:hypothetical protein
MKENGRWPIFVSIPAFECKDGGTTRKVSVRTSCLQALQEWEGILAQRAYENTTTIK